MADKQGMKIKIISLLVLCLVALNVQARQYQAPVTDSKWVFEGNRVACTLKHIIPQYGVGTFEQASGEPVYFTLTSESYVPVIKTAELSTVPPVWMHESKAVKLASVKGIGKQVRIESDLTERLLQELSRGYLPQFAYKVSLQGQQRTKVLVSSVNFLESMEQFEVCRQGLLPFSRRDVHQHLSLFNNLSKSLTYKNKTLLNKAVTYIKEAGPTERIDLISGTEGVSVKDGRRMHDSRVDVIRGFLIEKDVPEAQIISLTDPRERETPKGSVRLNVAGPEPFQHIYFKEGSISLNERDHKKLQYMLTYAKLQQPNATFILAGHSDSNGPRHSNLLVSKKRLRTIRKYLLSQGVKANKIVTKAYGESRPVASNRYPGGRELNRRVDISISG